MKPKSQRSPLLPPSLSRSPKQQVQPSVYMEPNRARSAPRFWWCWIRALGERVASVFHRSEGSPVAPKRILYLYKGVVALCCLAQKGKPRKPSRLLNQTQICTRGTFCAEGMLWCISKYGTYLSANPLIETKCRPTRGRSEEPRSASPGSQWTILSQTQPEFAELDSESMRSSRPKCPRFKVQRVRFGRNYLFPPREHGEMCEVGNLVTSPMSIPII